MWQQRLFSSNTMEKNHCNVVSQKENDTFLATKPKDMEYCDRSRFHILGLLACPSSTLLSVPAEAGWSPRETKDTCSVLAHDLGLIFSLCGSRFPRYRLSDYKRFAHTALPTRFHLRSAVPQTCPVPWNQSVTENKWRHKVTG